MTAPDPRWDLAKVPRFCKNDFCSFMKHLAFIRPFREYSLSVATPAKSCNHADVVQLA
jgi:hypothetical protein